MKGKIAICWAGFTRTNSQLINFWKENILKPLQADLFICTRDIFFNSTNDPLNGKAFPASVPINYFQTHYSESLKKLEIRSPEIDFYKAERKRMNLPEGGFQGELLWRTLSYMHSIKRVLELRREYEKETQTKYDITILTRPDLHCMNVPSIDHLDESRVYFTGKDSHVTIISGYGYLISDHFLISKSENIDVLSDIYDRMEHYSHHIAADGKPLVFSNETLIGLRFLENNIPIQYDDFLGHVVRR